MVLVFAGFALVDFFTHFENPIARWLCAALFVLYWPYFLCATILTDSEMTDRDYLLFTGGIAFLAVSAGCLYDHFFPHFAQHRIYGDVPDYHGLKWAMGAALLFGYVMAIAKIERVRPKRERHDDVPIA